MGAKQSNNNTPMSKEEVDRRLEAQRLHYERKCQEMVARAASQNAQPVERERAPYNYSGGDLQQRHVPLYPNLNEASTSLAAPPQTYHQNNLLYQPQQQFVVDNQQFARMSPAPSAPCAPRGGARSRSVSRQRVVPQERDVFDCPTCGSRFGMRIFQCDSGHSSCSDCKYVGRPCGICRGSLTNRRNYDLENHIAQTKAPCLNASDGCKLFIKTADMDSHIKECPFKVQDCPVFSVFGTCHWKGKLNQIGSHFDSMHQNGRQANVDTEMRITNIEGNSQQLHLVLLGVYNFLFHIKVSESNGSIYMLVQLIGTKMSAEKWIYEIHVYNKNENRRKYTYTDHCRSSSEPVQDIFKEGDCAVLPVTYAKSFYHNGAISYKFFIKKSNEGRGDFKNQRGRGRNH